MPHVQTVLGPVDPAVLGRVLTHEHLLALTPGPWLSGGPGDPGAPERARRFAAQQVDLAVAALGALADHGFGTVVDLSPYGDAGRDAHGANTVLLQEISRRTGLHVVSGTAGYRAEFSPAWVRAAGVAELTRRFVADATQGIGGTGVRAGILGEQPTGEGRITAHEARGLRAAARAHHATGLTLSTHTTHGTMALEQLALLAEEGVEPQRVVIGHLDLHPDPDHLRRVLDTGATIAFDSIGKEFWDVRTPPPTGPVPEGEYTKRAVHRSDVARADRLARLVELGHAEQLVLSQDLTGGQLHLNPRTHGRWGYCYLPAVFTGLLTERGVSERQLDTMLRDNPARLLTVG
ncbi:phosphotriesterase family protein [Kitasatospora sp. LaBMicrA B282]|uniref:phosphotriesterase family protein n=1 Tax=Kitasatospora sp. LaBMicrA B282 TaxID=3420949 RepID=UPI003D125EEF